MTDLLSIYIMNFPNIINIIETITSNCFYANDNRSKKIESKVKWDSHIWTCIVHFLILKLKFKNHWKIMSKHVENLNQVKMSNETLNLGRGIFFSFCFPRFLMVLMGVRQRRKRCEWIQEGETGNSYQERCSSVGSMAPEWD